MVEAQPLSRGSEFVGSALASIKGLPLLSACLFIAFLLSSILSNIFYVSDSAPARIDASTPVLNPVGEGAIEPIFDDRKDSQELSVSNGKPAKANDFGIEAVREVQNSASPSTLSFDAQHVQAIQLTQLREELSKVERELDRLRVQLAISGAQHRLLEERKPVEMTPAQFARLPYIARNGSDLGSIRQSLDINSQINCDIFIPQSGNISSLRLFVGDFICHSNGKKIGFIRSYASRKFEIEFLDSRLKIKCGLGEICRLAKDAQVMMVVEPEGEKVTIYAGTSLNEFRRISVPTTTGVIR